MLQSVTVTGRIKMWDPHKGYGFIHTAAVGDVLVHRNDIRRDGWESLPNGADATAVAVQVGGKWRARRILSVTLVD